MKIGEGINIARDGTISAAITPSATIDWDQVVDTPTTLEGYGITDAATKEELAEVEAKIVHVFHFKGSVATLADLEAIENPDVGDVYNVVEDGKNYAWDGEAWSDLGDIIDLSNYWSKDELTALTFDDVDIITGYASSIDTFKEILKKGGEIDMAADIETSQSFTVDRDTVINLNGQDITGTVDGPLFNVDGARLTLKGEGDVTNSHHIAVAVNGGEVIIDGGNYNSTHEGVQATGEGSKIVMNNGTLISTECGLGVNRGAYLELNGGTVTTRDAACIGTDNSEGEGGNTIVMNGGELTGKVIANGYEAVGVYIANADSFTMNGGSIIAEGGAGIVMRSGNVVINDGYVEGRPSDNRPAGSTGWIGDSEINMSQSGVIYHESADYPSKENMSLAINGGTIKGNAYSLEVLSTEIEPAVVVTGGEFDPEYIPIN